MASLAGSAGCGGSAACNVPETVSLELRASADLNQGEDGASRSFVLRTYQLDHPGPFEQVAYGALWANPPEEVWGEALVAEPSEVRVLPGRRQVVQLRRHEKARYLVLAGRFRSDQAQWKLLMDMPERVDPCSSGDEQRPPTLSATASGYDLSLEVAP